MAVLGVRVLYVNIECSTLKARAILAVHSIKSRKKFVDVVLLLSPLR